MTLDDIFQHQAIIDKRCISSDIKEFLNKKRFSESKKDWIRYGDMHITHFIRVFMNGSDDLLAMVIDGFMKTLIKTGKAKKLTTDEFVEEITKNGKKHNYN